MIEITLNDLARSVEALKVLYAEKLPIKVSYRVSKMMDVVQKELDSLQKKTFELASEYGEPLNGGFKIKDEDQEEFKKVLEELSMEVVKFDFDKLCIPDTISISAKHLKELEHFIELGD